MKTNTKVKISRRKMSKDLGVDIAHISRIFSGKSMPSLELAYRIAEYMKITVDELCEILGVPKDGLPENESKDDLPKDGPEKEDRGNDTAKRIKE